MLVLYHFPHAHFTQVYKWVPAKLIIYAGDKHEIEEELLQGEIKIQCILSCHIKGSTSINWFFYLGFDEREKLVEYPEKSLNLFEHF